MENRLNELLGQQEIIVLDGALATELENRGLSINDALWSAKILAEKPEEIQAVHYDYFCAGADIGISASYQATIPGFSCERVYRAASGRAHQTVGTNFSKSPGAILARKRKAIPKSIPNSGRFGGAIRRVSGRRLGISWKLWAFGGSALFISQGAHAHSLGSRGRGFCLRDHPFPRRSKSVGALHAGNPWCERMDLF